MFDPRKQPPTSHIKILDPVTPLEPPKFGFQVSQKLGSWSNNDSSGEGIQFKVKKTEDHGVFSPPLWQNSTPTSPIHTSNNYRSLSQSARAEAIARGQWELMEMVKNMPESCYELSLKDLVEHQPLESQEQSLINKERNQGSRVKIKRQESNNKKNDQMKAKMMRSTSIENGGLFLKMGLPLSLGHNNNKKKKSLVNVTKVSPKLDESDNSSRSMEKDWWKKRFSSSGSSGSSGSTARSSSIGSSSSSNRFGVGILILMDSELGLGVKQLTFSRILASRSQHHRHKWLNQHQDNFAMEGSILQHVSKKTSFSCPMGELCENKSSVREKALKTLVEGLETNVRYEFAEEKFVTLVHRCQNCLKRGSALEIDLALQLIGLVALTLGSGDNAHEVYQDSLVFVPQVLKKPKSADNLIKAMECLSIVTFVAATDYLDTERSMEVIWQFLNNQESKSKGTKPSVTAAAISAWALLLSSLDPWKVDYKRWKGAISYLLKQLEDEAEGEDHYIVHSASIEALALIFEIGFLEKFSNQAQGEYASKEDIMKQVKGVCNNSSKQELLKTLDEDYNKSTTVTVMGARCTFSTWSRVKQINYIRRFLGYGFMNHMMENEYLRRVFNVGPPVRSSGGVELYKCEVEEVVGRVFIGDVKRRGCTKRIYKSPNSLMSKGKTKLMNEYRSLAEEKKARNYIADEYTA